MDFIIVLVFLFLYVIYTELRIRNIKKQKTKIYVPKELFENLKDTFQYINISLETIKEKQESIGNLYLKIMEIKKEIETWESKTKKKEKPKPNPNKDQLQEVRQETIEKDPFLQQEQMWEKLLKETNSDTVSFSFLGDLGVSKKEHSANSSHKENEKQELNLLEKFGATFRKFLKIPEIQPANYSIQKDFNFENQITETNPKIIPLQEYQERLNQENQKLTKEKNSNYTLENQGNPKQILIEEAKKIFSEIKQKEEKIVLIKKLLEIGFSEEEIHQITNLSNAELSLIVKLKKKG
ncbi:MAG: hypothetical protein ACK4UJ_12230 [Leptonema sp. (in: bacteria)]